MYVSYFIYFYIFFLYFFGPNDGGAGGDAPWSTDRIVWQPPVVEERKMGKELGRMAALLCAPLGLWRVGRRGMCGGFGGVVVLGGG